MICAAGTDRLAASRFAQLSLFAQNVRNFPQTKLDGELNAPFPLNEHGDLYFLFHNFNANNILSN